MQYRDGNISTCLIKTLVNYLCCACCALCQLSYSLFFYRYSLFIYLCSLFIIVFIHLFCSCSFSFIHCSIFVLCSLFKRENIQFWSWTVFQVFQSCCSCSSKPAYNIIYASQLTSYSRLHRLCLSIGAKDLLLSKT